MKPVHHIWSDVYATKPGNFTRGSARWQAKLDEADVGLIRQLIAAGISNTDIARKFEVSPRTVSAIKTGRNWRQAGNA